RDGRRAAARDRRREGRRAADRGARSVIADRLQRRAFARARTVSRLRTSAAARRLSRRLGTDDPPPPPPDPRRKLPTRR
ncbi:hypothetical protein, partial [Actinomadura violacea]